VTSQSLVENETQREEIGAVIERAALRLLGRHVGDRSENDARAGAGGRARGVSDGRDAALKERRRLALDDLGQPEVQIFSWPFRLIIRFSGLMSR
jgi:hypothetical protein